MAHKTTTTSAPPARADLGAVIADLDHLTSAWLNLAAFGSSVTGVKALLGKKIRDLESSNWVYHSQILLSDFETLIKICERVRELGDSYEIQARISGLCAHIVSHKTSIHPCSDKSLAAAYQGTTELQVLESLYQWVSLGTMIDNTLDDTGDALEQLDVMISYDLRGIHLCTTVDDDCVSLRILELASKILRGLRHDERHFMEDIIEMKIGMLQGSDSVTFSKVNAPGSECIGCGRPDSRSAKKNPAPTPTERAQESRAVIARLKQENSTLVQEKADALVMQEQNETRLAFLEHHLFDKDPAHILITSDPQEERYRSWEAKRLFTKFEESLAEADEDKSIMSKEIAKLSTDTTRLTIELGQSKSTLEEIQESNRGFERAFDRFNVEKAQYEQELAVAGGILLELDHEKAAMQNTLDNISKENTSLRQQLATANEEIEQIKSTEPHALDDGLLAERNSLQNDLYEANGKLDQIRGFLGPSPVRPVPLLPYWQPWIYAYAGNFAPMPVRGYEEPDISSWSADHGCSQDETVESKILGDAKPSARSISSEKKWLSGIQPVDRPAEDLMTT